MVTKTDADADFSYPDVIIGADLNAVRCAYENNYVLIKNRPPYHHSYEPAEREWANKIYQLYGRGLVPFTNIPDRIRMSPGENTLRVFTNSKMYTVRYERVHVYDDDCLEGYSLGRQLLSYRVIDWFDCQGLYNLDFDTITTGDKFVHNIKLFKSRRIDGNQKYLDLLCESFLSKEQLKSFDYSDTMARFKVTGILKERGITNPRMSLWKRDTYPIYETI